MIKSTKIIFCFLILCSLHFAGQDYGGFFHSEHGKHINFNSYPSNLSDLDNKWDFNILSLSGELMGKFLTNGDLHRNIGNPNAGLLSFTKNTETGDYALNADFVLPSVAYKINDNSGIAFTWRTRVFGYGRSSVSDYNLFASIGESSVEYDTYGIDFATAIVNTWQDFSFSYGHAFKLAEQHRLEGGVNFKVLVGGASGFVDFNTGNVGVNANNQISYNDGRMDMAFNRQLEETLDGEGTNLFSTMGIGMGFNVAYKFLKPNAAADKDYKLKLATGVSDIGGINYTSSTVSGLYELKTNDSVSLADLEYLETVDDVYDFIEDKFYIDNSQEEQTYVIRLPTSWNFLIDYQVRPKLFVSYQSRLTALDARLKYFESQHFYKFDVGLRYEARRWGVYTTAGHHEFSGFNSSIGARYSFIYLGVSNLFTGADAKNIKKIGVTCSLRFGIK